MPLFHLQAVLILVYIKKAIPKPSKMCVVASISGWTRKLMNEAVKKGVFRITTQGWGGA
jgi:hypothetical protein